MIRILLGRAWRFFPQRKYLRVCRAAHEFLNFFVDLALAGRDGDGDGSGPTMRHSLVQVLSSQTSNAQFIKSQVLQGIMAAQETTSALLGNTFFLLSRHPVYWGHIRTEVLAKGEKLLNFDDLLESTVLHNISLECECDRFSS
ncbi:hypothetical protein GGR56DRAFT_154810 [Xylariaceae sp. FL0804]|nr:hypothetical protein GGR56DRAFT_154810 [Xylariaceae sp. FL0804]